jgi:hypothetical protein
VPKDHATRVKLYVVLNLYHTGIGDLNPYVVHVHVELRPPVDLLLIPHIIYVC